MIKKFNIILLVSVITMVIVRFGADVLSSSGGPRPDDTPPASSEAAALSPRIVYDMMVPFAMENPITGHNGCILDLMRAVFPNARFDERELDVEKTYAILTNDATAVSVIYGDQKRLRGFPRAPTPLAWTDIVLYTRRTLEWSYAGPASLTQIRIGITADYENSEKLVRMCEASSKSPKPVTIYGPDDRYYRDPLAAVLDGKVDAVAMARTSFSSATIGITADLLVKFNVSPPIDRLPLYLIVSDRDPEYAKRVIDTYEAGRRTVEASGMLRRIEKYYGISNEERK